MDQSAAGTSSSHASSDDTETFATCHSFSPPSVPPPQYHAATLQHQHQGIATADNNDKQTQTTPRNTPRHTSSINSSTTSSPPPPPSSLHHQGSNGSGGGKDSSINTLPHHTTTTTTSPPPPSSPPTSQGSSFRNKREASGGSSNPVTTMGRFLKSPFSKPRLHPSPHTGRKLANYHVIANSNPGMWCSLSMPLLFHPSSFLSILPPFSMT